MRNEELVARLRRAWGRGEVSAGACCRRLIKVEPLRGVIKV